MENKDIIIPIYLYHYYIDNNFFSKISLTEIKETNWILHKLFYVFSNNIRPIPEGTKLYYVKHKKTEPYNIIEYKFVYDTENNIDDKDKISFITYNRPVYNTIELYFYFNPDIQNNVFATFDNNMLKNTKWKLTSICPIIYVLPNKDIKFYLNNGRCLPMPVLKNTFDVYNNKYQNINFKDCLKINKPYISILDIVKNYNRINQDKLKNIEKDTKNNNKKPRFIYIIFIIILILIIITFILYYKKIL
jgi:hypothetical protein